MVLCFRPDQIQGLGRQGPAHRPDRPERVLLVQRQPDRHARSGGWAGIDCRLPAGGTDGEPEEAQAHAAMPAAAGGVLIEAAAIVRYFELDCVAEGGQPDCYGGCSSELVGVAEELLRRPVQEQGRLPVHFHPVVRCFQEYFGAAFAQRESETVDGPGHTKNIEIDRSRIGENATHKDYFLV